MAEANHAPVQESLPARPIPIAKPKANALHIPTPSVVPLPAASASLIRNSHLNLDTFSPVNQNGSFEFDRVLKSGYVQKRTRKTKVRNALFCGSRCRLTVLQTWKQIYLVLRPNYLSIYKDAKEDKLRHKINLADLTAVAFLKDPKQKRQNVFGLFSPSRNYHLEASSGKDAGEWVELIRSEARIEEEEEEMMLASPGGTVAAHNGFERATQHYNEQRRFQDERLGSSSPEPLDAFPPIKAMRKNAERRASHTIEYSGTELASHSDMSEGDGAKAKRMSRPSAVDDLAVQAPAGDRPMMQNRNVSQMSGLNAEDPERVVWHGYLLMLKTKGGVKQWKDLWAVIRLRSLSVYKNDSEYSPILILPLSSIINVVEIDPISRTKRHCLQVITEEKSYKFCAHSEDTLDKSLGAFKSLLAKRKDYEMQSKVAR